MRKVLLSLFLSLGLTACAASGQHGGSIETGRGTYPLDGPRVLVAGEELSGDSLPSNGATFKAILAAMKAEFARDGLVLFDETDFRLDDMLPERRRSDRELIAVARSADGGHADLSSVLVISLAIEQRLNSDRTLIQPRVRARVLDVQDALAGEPVALGPVARIEVPGRCDWDCVTDAISSEARAIARDLRAKLVPRYLK